MSHIVIAQLSFVSIIFWLVIESADTQVKGPTACYIVILLIKDDIVQTSNCSR